MNINENKWIESMMPKKDDFHDINWFEVACCFYYAVGGSSGCGDLDSIEYLCNKYSDYFEEEE